MRITVVIPSWNGRPLLERCLRALDRQRIGEPFTVVVVDNGSGDGTCEWLRRERPHVRLVALPQNRGFAGAVNAGIDAGEGPYVALLNNDAEPEAGWLAALVEALDRHPEYAFAACRMLQMDDPEVIDSAGDAVTVAGVPYKRGHGGPARGRFLEAEEVTSACAGAALYRRDAFGDVGPFEDRFFAYFEDVDWSLRARLRGHRCLYVPAAVVRHAGGATSCRIDDLARMRIRNCLYLLFRTFPLRLLAAALPVIVVVRLLSLLLEAGRGGLRPALRPYADLVRDAGWLLATRRRIQAGRRISPRRFLGQLDLRVIPEEIARVVLPRRRRPRLRAGLRAAEAP